MFLKYYVFLKYYESYYKLYTYNKKQRKDDRERESRDNVPAYTSKRYLVMLPVTFTWHSQADLAWLPSEFVFKGVTWRRQVVLA